MSRHLPPGWIEAIDPSTGQTYFANAVTGESSWSVPGGWAQPNRPPPPPPPPRSTAGESPSKSVLPPAAAAAEVASMGGRFVPATRQPDEQPPPSSATASSSAASISTLASGGFIVPAARAVMDAKGRNPDAFPDLELQSLSAGQIADLHSLRQEQLNGKEEDGSFEPYVAINPYSLPETAKRTPMEAGRLDIRVHSLYDKLKKIPQ